MRTSRPLVAYIETRRICGPTLSPAHNCRPTSGPLMAVAVRSDLDATQSRLNLFILSLQAGYFGHRPSVGDKGLRDPTVRPNMLGSSLITTVSSRGSMDAGGFDHLIASRRYNEASTTRCRIGYTSIVNFTRGFQFRPVHPSSSSSRLTRWFVEDT